MKLAITSGKGGTGKTTVSSALIKYWARDCIAIDTDVEEPNLNIFLQEKNLITENAVIEKPVIDYDKCNNCGECIEFCQFNCLATIQGKTVVFPEMCHSCGGCALVCSKNAISYEDFPLGEILYNDNFMMGRMKIGEAISPMLIKQLYKKLDKLNTDKDVLIDTPPGTSCPVMMAVYPADYILLVTEPTPFGVSDLKMAVEAFTPLNKPMGIVINKAGIGDNEIYDFCSAKEIPILAEIPYSEEVAKNYSKGNILKNGKELAEEICGKLL